MKERLISALTQGQRFLFPCSCEGEYVGMGGVTHRVVVTRIGQWCQSGGRSVDVRGSERMSASREPAAPFRTSGNLSNNPHEVGQDESLLHWNVVLPL